MRIDRRDGRCGRRRRRGEQSQSSGEYREKAGGQQDGTGAAFGRHYPDGHGARECTRVPWAAAGLRSTVRTHRRLRSLRVLEVAMHRVKVLAVCAVATLLAACATAPEVRTRTAEQVDL